MTRKQFDDFLKHKGRVLYRGRWYITESDKPTWPNDLVYMQQANGSGWFVAGKQELLSNEYVYEANEEQLKMEIHEPVTVRRRVNTKGSASKTFNKL